MKKKRGSTLYLLGLVGINFVHVLKLYCVDLNALYLVRML